MVAMKDNDASEVMAWMDSQRTVKISNVDEYLAAIVHLDFEPFFYYEDLTNEVITN